MKQTWGFLTNHALVLIYVVRHNGATVREISAASASRSGRRWRSCASSATSGIVERHRDGRRTTYSVNFDRLAAYRREGTVSLTPREFVDGLIQTLLAISEYHGAANGPGCRAARLRRARAADRHVGVLHEPRAAAAVDRRWTARRPCARWRVSVGVTERAVVAILNQLEDDGIILSARQGRRNTLRHRLRGAARRSRAGRRASGSCRRSSSSRGTGTARACAPESGSRSRDSTRPRT